MQPIITPLTSESHAYSQAYKHNGFLITAGQIGINPVDGLLADGVAAQTQLALANLSTVLAAGGSDLGRVLRTSCVLADMAHFREFDSVYREVFAGHKPARVTISATLGKGLLVEIDAIAAVAE